MFHVSFRPISKHIKSIGNNVIGNARYSTKTEAEFEVPPFKLHMLEECPCPNTTVKLTRDEALKMYKDMQVIRSMEQKAGTLYQEKFIRGFLHLYSGQEAIAVGMKSVLHPEDAIITAYRCHGWSYLDCYSVSGILAELMGRVTGVSRGRGGSMHLYGPTFFGGNGIVGAQIPVGTGIALALKYKDKKNVCVTLYGDGAANQGQAFESYNIAKLHLLPCIYVCENNKYGMGTSDTRSSANPNYYTRCEYIPGIQGDGMSIFSMREAMRFAQSYCLSGKGPIIIEAVTYRYYGHSMSDPGVSYRSREEIKEVRENRDPIKKFQEAIVQAGLATDDEITNISKTAKKEVEEATKEAMKAAEPPDNELSADIYAKNIEKDTRGVTPWKPLTLSNTKEPLNVK